MNNQNQNQMNNGMPMPGGIPMHMNMMQQSPGQMNMPNMQQINMIGNTGQMINPNMGMTQ